MNRLPHLGLEYRTGNSQVPCARRIRQRLVQERVMVWLAVAKQGRLGLAGQAWFRWAWQGEAGLGRDGRAYGSCRTSP